MGSAFENLAPRVMRELISDFDLTVEQAAGIVGNLNAESGLLAIAEKRPTIAGSRGGFGWAQWTGPRRIAFERWAGSRGFDLTSYAANYGYLRAELDGSVPGFDYRSTITQLRRTTTYKDAALRFEASYEGAGIKRLNSRIDGAYRAMKLYEAASPPNPRHEDVPMPPPSVPLPDPAGKPWYLSKTVIGGLIAIALPLLSAAFPALKLVDPNSATDLVLKIVQIVGPIVGGALAIFGRTQVTQPIRGTKSEDQSIRMRGERATAPEAIVSDLHGGIMSMPLEAIVAELPMVVEAIGELTRAAAGLRGCDANGPANDETGSSPPGPTPVLRPSAA